MAANDIIFRHLKEVVESALSATKTVVAEHGLEVSTLPLGSQADLFLRHFGSRMKRRREELRRAGLEPER